MSASEIEALAKDFANAGPKVAKALYDAMKEGGEVFAEEWRSNAVITSGTHGKHYPNSITSETQLGFGVVVDTGPESGMRQGGMGMGFEFGSENQPPHLDGAKALSWVEPRIERMADAAIGLVLP